MHENKILTLMIEIYCNHTHKTNRGEICTECSSLLEYSLARLRNCPLQPKKPVCSNCRIHCYQEEMRNKIKTVMRFSGKKMLLSHPILSVHYVLKKVRKTG